MSSPSAVSSSSAANLPMSSARAASSSGASHPDRRFGYGRSCRQPGSAAGRARPARRGRGPYRTVAPSSRSSKGRALPWWTRHSGRSSDISTHSKLSPVCISLALCRASRHGGATCRCDLARMLLSQPTTPKCCGPFSWQSSQPCRIASQLALSEGRLVPAG